MVQASSAKFSRFRVVQAVHDAKNQLVIQLIARVSAWNHLRQGLKKRAASGLK
jgi:hypothetical protein